MHTVTFVDKYITGGNGIHESTKQPFSRKKNEETEKTLNQL